MANLTNNQSINNTFSTSPDTVVQVCWNGNFNGLKIILIIFGILLISLFFNYILILIAKHYKNKRTIINDSRTVNK